ncbi:hypothetical protein C3B44_06665 [Corynebacterium yudongzhengii]|uniref:Uncharacterized protein n=1 Tax=Corynebacterium yudongzhengii TaxID=2080740 RepID=A0A2U1T987_9CORY|nr:hypothetical protein [Corynebacterium yudongzhengii]AWB82073.1 hypothetical protein C3B44_06665 [Corynebacterium yudongzhengii]PWC02577.1 hypothetical protein DF222_01135 [Corynebacterium yudongzhengii]
MTAMVSPRTTVRSTTALDANEAAWTGARREIALPGPIQFAYTTRFVSQRVAAAPADFRLIAGAEVHSCVGDVAIAKITHIENHKRVETPSSRKAIL